MEVANLGLTKFLDPVGPELLEMQLARLRVGDDFDCPFHCCGDSGGEVREGERGDVPVEAGPAGGGGCQGRGGERGQGDRLGDGVCVSIQVCDPRQGPARKESGPRKEETDSR